MDVCLDQCIPVPVSCSLGFHHVMGQGVLWVGCNQAICYLVSSSGGPGLPTLTSVLFASFHESIVGGSRFVVSVWLVVFLGRYLGWLSPVA